MPPLVRVDRRASLPLSFNEEGQLYLDWLSARRGAPRLGLNAALVLRVDGPFDIVAATRALEATVARHEIFRTGFRIGTTPGSDDAGLFGRILHARASLSMDPTIDIRSDLDGVALLDRVIEADMQRPFDYEVPPLARARLIRCGPTDHVVLLVLSHVICDRWALGIVRNDFESFYGSFVGQEAPPSAPPAFDYIDFAAWQKAAISVGAFDASLEYWLARWRDWKDDLLDWREVSGIVNAAAADAPRLGAAVVRRLPAASASAARQAARRLRVTPYVAGLATLFITLHRLTGRRRIAIWANFANRAAAALQSVVGWCSTSHLVTAECRLGSTVGDVMRDVQRGVIDGFPHLPLPTPVLFQKFLAETAGLHSALSGAGIYFDVVAKRHSHISGVTMTPMRCPAPRADRGLSVVLVDDGDGMSLVVESGPKGSSPDVGPLVCALESTLAQLTELDRPI